MAEQDPGISDQEREQARIAAFYEANPWATPPKRKRHRVKLFKSGNSLAVRLPAGLELRPGMEMDLIVEDGRYLRLDPVEGPKRKFDIAKVAGSAWSLQPIKPEDRIFEERPSERHDQSEVKPAA